MRKTPFFELLCNDYYPLANEIGMECAILFKETGQITMACLFNSLVFVDLEIVVFFAYLSCSQLWFANLYLYSMICFLLVANIQYTDEHVNQANNGGCKQIRLPNIAYLENFSRYIINTVFESSSKNCFCSILQAVDNRNTEKGLPLYSISIT